MPSCPQVNLGSTLPVSISGSTAGRANALSGASCGGGGASAPDYAYQWTAPSAGTYTIDTFGSSFDTVLYVRNATCGGPELACNDDASGVLQSQVTVTLAAGQTIIIVVDGYRTNSGTFSLRITGNTRPSATPTATPTPTPPMPSCPQVNLGSTLPVSISGSTAGRANALDGASCGAGGTAPDYAYQWTAPSAGTYVIDTLGSSFDTVLYVRDASCSGAELACNDDVSGMNHQSRLSVALAAGQTIVIVVDGYGSASGSYNVHVKKFSLDVFPIPNRTHLTASINSVFDHSASMQYCADDRVVAYTGEEGRGQYGSDLVGNITSCGSLYGFKNAAGTAFSVGGQYAGGGQPQYLYYDGHPGYDYRTTDQCPGGAVTEDCPTGVRGQIRIRAAAAGTVKALNRTYGRIEIDHGNGYETWYMHLSRFDVTVGEAVAAGDYIGVAGDTGAPGNPHLHFEVRKEGVPTDPYGWTGAGIDPYTRTRNTLLWTAQDSSSAASAGLIDDEVTIDKLILCVNVALGIMPLADCPAFDLRSDKRVAVDELIHAVSILLHGRLS
jgi:hypothetical protein